MAPASDGHTPSRIELLARLEVAGGSLRRLEKQTSIPRTTLRRLIAAPKMDDELVAFLSDQHAPYHDLALLRLTCEWLSEHQPHLIVLLGDLGDFPTLSRHPHRRGDPTMDECIAGVRVILKAYRQACPHSRILLVPGNHDLRPTTYMDQHAPAMAGHERSLAEEIGVVELGIEVADDYPHGLVVIVPGQLVATHGQISRKGSGNSARAEAERMWCGVVQGHVHRLGVVMTTKPRVDGVPGERVFWSGEAGFLSRADYHRYTARPDWQQGFLTATVRHGEVLGMEAVPFIGGRLHWRGESYGAEALGAAA